MTDIVVLSFMLVICLMFPLWIHRIEKTISDDHARRRHELDEFRAVFAEIKGGRVADDVQEPLGQIISVIEDDGQILVRCQPTDAGAERMRKPAQSPSIGFWAAKA
jgi:hypothetical protein